MSTTDQAAILAAAVHPGSTGLRLLPVFTTGANTSLPFKRQGSTTSWGSGEALRLEARQLLMGLAWAALTTQSKHPGPALWMWRYSTSGVASSSRIASARTRPLTTLAATIMASPE